MTDDSTYLQRECTDGKELLMFKREEMITLPDRIYSLFGHMERAQEMADCGYAFAKKHHMWKNRAEYIREYFLDM